MTTEIPDLHPPSSRRKGIMLCYPFEEKRLLKWGTEVFVQPKLDGERCRAIINAAGEVTLLSSEESLILSVPHITRALRESGLRDIELDGELYAHGKPFEDIHSVVGRSVNLHPDHEAIAYHVFDVVMLGPQYKRLEALYKIPRRDQIIPVPTFTATTVDDLMRCLDTFVDEGFEGLVVRHPDAVYERKRSRWVMKFKPKKEDYFVIIGSKEEYSIDGYPKGRLGALVCDDTTGGTFDVGTGFDADTRSALWAARDSLPGRVVHVAYQSINPSGAPRFPVFKEIVEVPECSLKI